VLVRRRPRRARSASGCAPLSLTGEWLPAVLDQAHEQLTAIRASQPHAGGLIIAIDHEHAKGIVDLMRRRHGVTPTLVLSDDPTASARIEHFAEGSMPWIVAVRMVSEGVDIPRLRVGVFATNTATELFFRQAAGRLVRWTRGMRHQEGVLLHPDDPRLRTFAAQIADQRRHSLRRRDDDERTGPDPESLDELSVGAREEQLSLFSVISAVALGSPHQPEWLADDYDAGAAGEADDADDLDDSLVIDLLPRPGPAAVRRWPRSRSPVARHKAQLRDENADRARDIVRMSGLTRRQVNGELNRLSGVGKVSEATVEQLETRLAHADRWLTRL
jgi:superfamily II DNA or RNA helicase